MLTARKDTLARPTAALADFVSQARYEDLPDSVLVDARRTILDWLGCVLAGSREVEARLAKDVVSRLGSSQDATLFADGRASSAGAALANGVATHVLELDDIHKGSTIHGAAPIIPAAVAVAERQASDSRELMRAVVLGYEAALRIGEAVNPSHYRFWHPTGTAATFGAAVAAGSLLGLDAAQMTHALGSAGTQASGLWEFNADGAMSKVLHPGKAAMNGVLAADLASLGFTGATRILEGERGFFRATSQEFDASKITENLGESWKIAENCFKLHACCGHTHTAIDAALELRSKLGWSGEEAAEQVAALLVETYGPGFEIVKEMNPKTPYQAKFSLAYVVAAALLEGRVGLEQFAQHRFAPEGTQTPAIASLLGRISIEVSSSLTSKYPQAWPAHIQLELRDGTRLSAGGDYPKGNPENPVTTDELKAKFSSLVVPSRGAAVAERAIELVETLGLERDLRSHLSKWSSLSAA